MSETFDLAAFIDGSSYPRKSVTVYTNVAALKEAEDLKEQIAITDDLKVAEQLEQKLDLVRVDIEKSGLTFELQGMPFRMAQEIANVFDDENPATDEEVLNLIHTCIQSVTATATGATSSVPSKELLEVMHKKFSPKEFGKLIATTVEVNFSAATYEAGVDAGFPVGGADVE